MTAQLLQTGRLHLAHSLEAVQRGCFHLPASARKLRWPLGVICLYAQLKNTDFFESMAVFKDRIAKLLDTMGAAMRHAVLLMSEVSSPFLRVPSLFEKPGFIGWIEQWQLSRTMRNLPAHTYDTDHAAIAEHVNQLNMLRQPILAAAGRMLATCASSFNLRPAGGEFAVESQSVRSASVAVL